MIKRIVIDNFRCLQQNVEIKFENDITLIVGENDAGKTSLVEAMKVILQGKKVEQDDFSWGTNQMKFLVDIDDYSYLSKHNLENDSVVSHLYISLSHQKLTQMKTLAQAEQGNEACLKDIADKLGVTYRVNTPIGTLYTNIINKIDGFLTENDPIEIEIKLPSLNVNFLDGKHFEDISLFINDVYFKDKRKNIWSEVIEEDQTIEAFIREKLSDYATEINININEGGIKDKIQEFLPSLTEIAVASDFEPRDLNINVLVKLLERGKEISIAKKGDGTKRRITMALLDYNINTEVEPIYIFDEVDTHLHVKAQLDLLRTIKSFADQGRQTILTTHSPFLINACNPQQIRKRNSYQ